MSGQLELLHAKIDVNGCSNPIKAYRSRNPNLLLGVDPMSLYSCVVPDNWPMISPSTFYQYEHDTTVIVNSGPERY